MADKGPKTSRINDFAEFTAHIQENCQDDLVLFRGQNEDKPLLPRIARLTPRDGLPDVEVRMLREFKRQSAPHVLRALSSDWDWLTLAQHHGMATRLLDWSASPLAALWFAVASPGKPSRKHDAVVWIFRPPPNDVIDGEATRGDKAGDPFSYRRSTAVFKPNFVTPRIVAQAGWFTAHKYLKDGSGFGRLEADPAYRNRLEKLLVAPKAFSNIRYYLDRFGVNQGSLFPDLDGVARHVEWLHVLLDDEADPNDAKPPSERKARKRQ